MSKGITRHIRLVLPVLFSVLFTSCFTGVESTPKITQKELKKKNVKDTPEKHVLDAVVPDKPTDWQRGRRFYIADNRASRGAWRITPPEGADSIEGRFAVLMTVDTVQSLTDDNEVTFTLGIEGKDISLEFRTGLTSEQWRATPGYVIPHVIDMQLVDEISNILKGNSYYILPSRRIGSDGNDTIGTRYQPVEIIAVEPGYESAPVRLYFTDDEGHLSSIYMTIGDAATSRRNFDTLFSFTDPRQKYKNITDKNWELIRHGNIVAGMTPEECRLALGSPDSYTRIPTTMGMVERWTYTNGVYLIFEDGLLSKFRK